MISDCFYRLIYDRFIHEIYIGQGGEANSKRREFRFVR